MKLLTHLFFPMVGNCLKLKPMQFCVNMCHDFIKYIMNIINLSSCMSVLDVCVHHLTCLCINIYVYKYVCILLMVDSFSNMVTYFVCMPFESTLLNYANRCLS